MPLRSLLSRQPWLRAVLLATSLFSSAHAMTLDHIEPRSWWVGMKQSGLQLMLHGQDIGRLKARVEYPGVRLLRQQGLESPNYLVLDLEIGAEARPGTLSIELREGDRLVLSHPYPLQARAPGSAQREGFGPKDAIYLVVPDRFAKGLPAPDAGGMSEGERRELPGGRHGGNLAGMRQHLDYVAAMGFTQIWPTPLTENNGLEYSYHGYASTDLYRVDPRFGSNEDFRAFAAEARERGVGVIQDIVLNHIGARHWWMQDLPTRDWVNQWPRYTETSHFRMSVQDPYGTESDRRAFSDGWFSPNMPDLNQRQPVLANYLIQMSLWWIEYAGLSGVRTDTYSYSDKAFLARWSQRMLEEYPRLNLVGEEWSPHPAVVAYWQRGKRNHDGYVSHMPSMMDFPLHGALLASLTEPEGHDSGFTKLYEALAHDFVYADPARLVVFEGNHDTPRVIAALHGDLALYKMATAYLAMTRRIPQFFYGSEVLLSSPRERDDGAVRGDFPGGWAGDAVNAFTGQGLDARQREAQDWLRRLLNWRKGQPAIHEGRLVHYSPRQGVYVLFRQLGGRTLMLVLHKGATDAQLDIGRFPEMLKPGQAWREVMTGRQGRLAQSGDTLPLPARSAQIFELGD